MEKLTGDIKNQFFPIHQMVSQGYAAAIFDVKDASPDDKIRFTDGILNKLYPKQQSIPDGMRGLSAWAWESMRAMDYFETDEAIDEQKACVVGKRSLTSPICSLNKMKVPACREYGALRIDLLFKFIDTSFGTQRDIKIQIEI